MKPKYKLKSWVIICVYIISIGAIVSSLFLVGKTLQSKTLSYDNLSYVFRGIVKNNEVPVISNSNEDIIKPYDSEEVIIAKNFYDKNDDPKIQEQSLMLYEKTYMPNTGTLYSSKNTFDIINILDGTVEDIVADDILGNIITIKHSNNLTTIYQSLNEVHIVAGDVLKQGDIIGTSGANKIKTDSENMLLFEVIYNGTNINPESFYQMDIKDLS
ncbi:MAG: M23 family metallopeptidase [Bacilli bacterium]|nr:M23 family metallopeptidase [Bacilli bacterium]